jgi:opacity protein-like surface antigen
MTIKKRLNGQSAGIIAATLLVASSAAFAGGPEVAPAPQAPFGTIIVGGGLMRGGVYATDRDNLDFFDDRTGLVTLSDRFQAKYSGATGYAGDLFVGFATRYWHYFNLALTASVNAAPKTRAEVNTDNFNNPLSLPRLGSNFNELYLNPTWNASLSLGYLMKPDVSVYGSVGYSLAVASFRRYSSLAGVGVDTLGLSAPLQTFDVTRHKNLDGITAGLGFFIKLASNTSLGFGYTWSEYDSIRSLIRVQDTSPNIRASGVLSFDRDPETETFNLSLAYAFAPVTPFEPAQKARQGSEFYVAGFVDRDNSFSDRLSNGANARNPAVGQIPPDFNNFYTRKSQVSQAWGFEGLLGYGYTLESGAYLGGEVFYNTSSSTRNSSTSSVIPAGVSSASADSRETETTSLRLGNSYGVDLVPGYKLDKNILLFVKLGVAERDLRQRSGFTTTSTTPGALRNVRQFTYNESYDLFGYQLGVGFDVRLAHNLFLRNEYVVTNYSNRNTRHRTNCCSGRLLNNGNLNGFFVSDDVSYNTTSNTYKLGLEYKLPV